MKKQQIFKNNFEVALAQPVGALDTTIILRGYSSRTIFK